MTVTLADYTSPALIVPQLRPGNAFDVIQELSQVLHRDGRLPDLAAFSQAALTREMMVSTAMDYGMAFPHARLKELKHLCFSLGRTAEPIFWVAGGTAPVRLMFLSAVPLHEAGNYLPLISGFARLSKDSQLLEKMHAARNAQEMFALLKQVKLRISREALRRGS